MNKPIDPVFPADLDAEKSVLASMLLSPDACDEGAMLLSPDDFFLGDHATLFRAIMHVHEQGKPPDLALVIDRLQAVKRDSKTEFEAIGGSQFLMHVKRSTPTPAHVVHYAEIVRRKSALRQAASAGTDLTRGALEPDADPDEVLGAAETRLTEIASGRIDKRGEVVDLSRAFNDALNRVENRQQSQCGEGIATGYRRLDEITGGLRAKELTIIGARPSCGKSALAMNVCENIALGASQSVLLVSLEMAAGDIAERVLSSQARAKLWQMRNGTLSRDRMGDLVAAAAKFHEARLWIDDAPSRSVSEIASLARRQKRRGGLDLLVVDYLQLVRPENPRDSREQQVAKVSRRLKVLARELAIPVVCLAQLNRQSDQGNRAPKLSDLRESGSIEQDADMVWFIHWPDGKPADTEQAEIHVSKNRQGPTGVVKLYWSRDYVRFDDQRDEPWEEKRHHWTPEQMRDKDDF